MRAETKLVRSIVLTLVVWSLACPALAAADSKPSELRSDREAAVEALDRAEDALEGRGVRTGREASHALLELARAVPALGRGDRREARSLLARPTDGASDPHDGGWTAPALDQRVHCTANFCIHWVVSTADAPDLADSGGTPGVPDYVETMATEFENVFQVENGSGTGQLAWLEPKSDGTLGGDLAKTDVYISDLGPDGIFGYAAPDSQAISNSLYGYLVMDDDYAGYGYADPLDPLRVTAAHEYNHVLQFTYDAYQDLWMFESTAVWAEEKVYDAIDDYLSYLPTWAFCAEVPLTEAPGTGPCRLKIYGSAVWNLWLDERYGAEVVRAAWAGSLATSPASLAPAAYDSAIRTHGGSGFVDDFNRFAAAVAEWRAPGSGLSEGAAFGGDVERVGTLPDGSSATWSLDHTSFAHVDVPVPPGSPPWIRLNVAIPSGTPGAVALVARTGASPAGGTVTTRIQQLPAGGTGGVLLENPGSYGRITAVLANASYGVSGYGGSDWVWTRDDQAFGAAVSTTGDPAPPGAGSGSSGGGTGSGAGTAGPAPSPGPAVDSTAPYIAQLGMSATSFRAAKAGPAIARARGTRLLYQLSEPATASFRVERLLRGRRQGATCARPTRRNRRRRACTRVAPSGSFTHDGRAGVNEFRFRGRVNDRRLRPGRYRMTVGARDAAGNESPQRTLRFEIVR
jgi:hypothetical protein